jgi:hypothetical protein
MRLTTEILSLPNPTLFNCLTDCQPPKVGEFIRFLALPVVQDLECCGDRLCRIADQEHEADFWTVYGQRADGESEAVTDVSTKRRALYLVGLFNWYLR